MTLSDVASGRDNNFNLIRILAAYAVLVTHSFALVTGDRASEPLTESLGTTMGTIAVDVFFLASGFLVTASILARQSAVEFVWARVLRVLPALLVMMLLTVFGLGLAMTQLSAQAYLTDRATLKYLVKGLTLLGGIEYELPGIFESNPFPRAFNGSLWTLPWEMRMYALLLCGWIAVGWMPGLRDRAFKPLLLCAAGLGAVLHIANHQFAFTDPNPVRLFFMFFSGGAIYVLRDRITLSWPLFGIALSILLASTLDRDVFFFGYLLTIAYIVFFTAYVPGGVIRGYNRLGDYSYGVYIYAFPVQQTTAALLPGLSVGTMVAVSSIVTIALAALSWHLVEQHALRLKSGAVARTQAFRQRRFRAPSST